MIDQLEHYIHVSKPFCAENFGIGLALYQNFIRID